MTTRDSRSRDVPDPTSPGADAVIDGAIANPIANPIDAVREPTQSLHFDPEVDSPVEGPDADQEPDTDSPSELARGTHNKRPVTAIESPSARGKTAPPMPLPRPPRSADDPADYLGAVLGSYRVLELLGKGGMGYVFRAEHVKLGREVALKLLRNDYASRRDAVTRFFQEARTVNRVRHRNIVDVTDFVELDDGTTYIVMELLTGTSLGSWAQAGIDLPRALAVLVQICDGLGAAHQVGVIHRDLKPDNVVVAPTPDGAELVKLLDFGVAKLVNRDDEDVGFQTAAGSVIGTPAYMSPEQAGGMVVDPRSDIYSLGAIMYELFTGQPMFRGRSFGEYVRKHLTEVPVPPHQTPGGAGIDPRIEAMILRCLDKDPDLRFASILELREALLRLLGGAGTDPPFDSAAYASGPPPLVLPPEQPMFPGVRHAPRAALDSQHSQPPHGAGIPRGPASTYDSGPSGHSHHSAHARRSGLSHPAPPVGRSHASGLTPPPPLGLTPPPLGLTPPPLGLPPPPPLPPPPVVTPPPAIAVAPSIPYVPPLTLEGRYSLPPRSLVPAKPPGSPSPPWWLWFAGGLAAVGVGIIAAIWWVGRGGPARPAPAATTAASTAAASAAAASAAASAPAATPAPPPAPALIEVRFESTPSGSVYADGRTAELCHTPCSFDIDPADGGPTGHRGFVVRRPGYADSPVTVDLTGGPRDFQLALRPLAEPPPAPTPPPPPPTPSAAPVPDARPAAEHRAIKRPERPARETRKQPAPDKADASPPAARKPGTPAIDPSDTLDPFRKK